MSYIAAITEQANNADIPPAIAVAVARRESGAQHYWQSGPLAGQVKRGKAGEIGIFQIKPSTARGINLEDPTENIKAGVGELARLYREFGTWTRALAAYNYGKRRVAKGTATALPLGVQQYVNAVLAMADGSGGGSEYYRPAEMVDKAAPPSGSVLGVVLIGGLLILFWLLD